MSGDEKRGDAAADLWRERFSNGRRETDLALIELDVRAEMKSFGEEETTGVIEQRALERQKRSDPPSGKLGMALRFKHWPQVAALVVLACLVGFLAWLGAK